MEQQRSRRAVWILFLAAALVQGLRLGAQTPPSRDTVPTKVYTDDAAKVSFRYPTVWTVSDKVVSYFPAVIAPGGEPVQVVASFSPQGNVYARTNLTGLDFIYRRVPNISQADCTAIVSSHGPPEPATSQAVINGVRFTSFATGDAGMSKSVSEQVYTTYRQGTCFLFEEDLHVVGAGVEGTRQLTAREMAALKRHLHDVMLTVTFGN